MKCLREEETKKKALVQELQELHEVPLLVLQVSQAAARAARAASTHTQLKAPSPAPKLLLSPTPQVLLSSHPPQLEYNGFFFGGGGLKQAYRHLEY